MWAYSKMNWGDLGSYIYGLGFNLDLIYKYRLILLVEGMFDYFALEPYFKCAGVMLTAQPSQSQLEILKRYVDRIIFIPDADKTGLRAEEYMKRYVSYKFKINVLRPQYKDLSKWRKENPTSFKEFFLNVFSDFISF